MADLKSLHARVFDTRWGQVLVMLEDDDDGSRMVFRLWQPVGNNGSLGMIEIKLGCGDGASDEANSIYLDAVWEALPGMDVSKVEEGLERVGIASLLDNLNEDCDDE